MSSEYINKNHLQRYRRHQEVDEDFFYGDKLTALGDSQNDAKQEQFLGKYISDKKLAFFFVFFLVIMSLLLVRVFYLQVNKGQYYGQLAEVNRSREKVLPAARGLIYDAQRRSLVKNLPIFDAYIMPRDLSVKLEKRQEQLQQIADILNLPLNDVEEKLKPYVANYKYLVSIKENIDYEQALLLKIQMSNLVGFYIELRNQREYAYPVEFSHLLGYIGKITDKEFQGKKAENYLLNDYIGKSGLELSYETPLRGEYGRELIEIDVTGQQKKVISHQEPINGANLVLSIDSQVQQKARELLQAKLDSINQKRGVLIMINPNDGAILAMVSLPDFDNNLFAKGISVDDYKKLIENENNPLFDRILKGEYPSGSTIKPVVAAGALQEEIVSDRTTFLSTGGLLLYDRWFFPDWSAGGHGLTNVYKAIAWSVNTYFYIIGGGFNDIKGLGVEGLTKYYKLFGLGAKTGIDLPGENDGLVPDPAWKLKNKNEEWFIGDTYHMAIGQGDVLVTPLQVANYTAAFANGGTLYKPHLVQEFDYNDGRKQVVTPEILRQNFIDPKNINIVRNAMRQTVTQGSAQYMNNLNVTSAGKTGTAQWNTEKANHAWYTGFAPFDKPELAITVLIEEGGEGSAVSVPVVHDLLNWYFNVYLPNKSEQ